jgi:DNA (cytosine-5)-methyltransferase 1
MMGYFIGDGWIEETKKKDEKYIHKIRFSINNKEVFERINKVFLITHKKFDSGINKKCKKFECMNLIWYNILKQFGKYAHGKLIPEWVQDAPKEFIQEFINGYMKTDGNINNNGSLQFTTDSLNLAYGLQRLYLKLGHIFSVNKCICPKTCTIRDITVNQRDIYIVRGILKKKHNTSSFIEDNYVWYQLSNITKREVIEETVYNFEVDIDNSYIVINTIVHNCQAFSNAGNKNSFDDKRGLLFEHILRIAKEKKPSFMFLENVKHIKKINNGDVYKYILQKINEAGYYIDDKKTIFELSPHNFGIPQQRERVIFVCIRNDIYDIKKEIKIVIPNIKINLDNIIEKNKEITNKYKISEEIENILNIWDEMIQKFDIDENLSPTILCNEFYNKYSETEFKKLPLWKREYITKNKPIYEKYKSQWDTWYKKNKNLIQQKEIYAKLEWQAVYKKKNDTIWNYFIQLRQSGIRVKRNNYFPTLVAIVQTPIYAKEKRYITPRECARLQSFPDDFIIHNVDKIAYKQFGNSVNVIVIHHVIKNTLETYNII